MSCLFRADSLTKRYGSVTVLDRCSVEFQAGEIHALLGANGAGKSTLVKIMAGLLPCTSGSMWLDEHPYTANNKRQAESCGVQIVQQELNMVPTLTVAENLQLGRLPQRLGIINAKELHSRARRSLDRMGLSEIDTQTPVGQLGIGQQQMLEIARSLDLDCRLLILDEPTATLSPAETQRLFSNLEELRNQGVAIVYISHRLDEVHQLADRATILRDGKCMTTCAIQDLTVDSMITLMSGRDRTSRTSFQSHATDQISLDVRNYSLGTQVQDVSFQAYRGERLGISGLVGAGRTELIRLIFGADHPDSGTVALAEEGVRHRFRTPYHSVRAGLAMVTEDRKSNGLLLEQSIQSNATLCSLWNRFSKWGILRRDIEESVTQEQVQSLEIRCNSVLQPVGQLSGGNQQKVAICKWLVRDASVLFFDEPTRGIDVAARQRIYSLMENLAKTRKTLVVVSSDLEELTQICDRILVMSAGRLTAQFLRGEWSTEKLNEAAFVGHRTQAKPSPRMTET